jgi:nitroreductase
MGSKEGDMLTPDQLLTTTRAVRRRLDLDRPVELAVVLECLRLAVQAPSGGNRQGWRWMVVTDPALRATAAEIYRTASLAAFEASRDSAADEGARKAYEGAIELARVLQEVPVLVVPCMLGRVDGASAHRVAGFHGSIWPAVWSFQLALRSRGLGSTLTTAHLRCEAEMADLLGIPSDVTQVALLPVAYTVGTDFKPARRQPIEDVVFENGWGNGVGSTR